MLQRKRNSLDSECVRDSQQITLSPNLSEGETEFAIGQLPSLFYPITLLRVFKLARDLQRIIFFCENIKVEAEAICFRCLLSVHLCQQRSSISMFCCFFHQSVLSLWVPSLGLVHATFGFLVITEKAFKLFPMYVVCRHMRWVSMLCSQVLFVTL